MKKNILLAFLFMLCLYALPAGAQSGQWVWLKGDSTGGSMGNYGAVGVPDINNNAPMNIGRGHWNDLQGNLWIMAYNGLWRYTTATNTWTLVHPSGGNGVYGTQGLPSPLNEPPALLNPAYWTDEAGDLWLFGGNYSTFELDALWRYHIATDEWTWMKGYPGVTPSITGVPPAVYGAQGVENAANTPGGRNMSGDYADWVINGDLWLFGGYASWPGLKNDLWRYHTATNNWVWEAGPQGFNLPGSYGVKGIAAAGNVPSARRFTSGWRDDSQNLYLFAGGAFGSPLNDIWKYDIPAGIWTWTGGDTIPGSAGQDIAYCSPENNAAIHARSGFHTTPADVNCTRAYWGMGGGMLNGVPVKNNLYNDLWLINAGTQTWTKVKGQSNGTPVPYRYGIKGVPHTDNLPRGRYSPCLWTDKAGNLYMFGGAVPDAGGNPSLPFSIGINDLWKFIPDTSCYRAALGTGLSLIPPADTLLCAGDSTVMTIPSGVPVIVTPVSGTRLDEAAGTLTFYGGAATTYAVVARPDDLCGGYDSIAFTIAPPPPPHAAFALSPGTAYLNDAVFNFVNQSEHAVSYAWYENGRLLGTTEDLVWRFSTAGEHCITLVAQNECGQTDTAVRCCKVISDPVVFVPNAFSPNGDGLNDVFRVYGGNFKLVAFDIYNRYGERIFNTNQPSRGWDGTYNGKRCDVGTYFYYIRYINNATNGEHMLKGDLALLP